MDAKSQKHQQPRRRRRETAPSVGQAHTPTRSETRLLRPKKARYHPSPEPGSARHAVRKRPSPALTHARRHPNRARKPPQRSTGVRPRARQHMPRPANEAQPGHQRSSSPPPMLPRCSSPSAKITQSRHAAQRKLEKTSRLGQTRRPERASTHTTESITVESPARGERGPTGRRAGRVPRAAATDPAPQREGQRAPTVSQTASERDHKLGVASRVSQLIA